MNRRSHFAVRIAVSLRHLLVAAVVTLPTLVACDKVKAAIRPGPDTRWLSDSALLASEPQVIFRVMPDGDTAKRVVPIATIGSQGLRELRMGARGWRAFDLNYLQSSANVVPLRRGRQADVLVAHRGFWEPMPRDTVRCQVPVPVGYARVTDEQVTLATSGPPTPLKYPGELSPAELQQAISTVPQLIAPTLGISTSILPRYERRVYQVPSGSGPNPTVVIVYDDPEVVADSIPVMGERPRHFIVVLDKGVYGYKPSWTYKSLGNRNDPNPRLRFLDFADVNGDGMMELFFGLRDYPEERYTKIMRFETDAWREALLHLGRRCQG